MAEIINETDIDTVAHVQDGGPDKGASQEETRQVKVKAGGSRRVPIKGAGSVTFYGTNGIALDDPVPAVNSSTVTLTHDEEFRTTSTPTSEPTEGAG